MKDATIEQLGQANKVNVTKDDTTVVEGAGSKEQIGERVAEIKSQIEGTTSDFDRDKLKERLARWPVVLPLSVSVRLLKPN